MKRSCLFLVLFITLSVESQRRTTSTEATSKSDTSKPYTRGRGRSRFIAPTEYIEPSEFHQSSEPIKRIVSRRKIAEPVERRTASPIVHPSRTYEVQEIINEPIDSFKRQSKSRVLTETKYNTLTVPSTRDYYETTPLSLQDIPDLNKLNENIFSNTIIQDTSSQYPTTQLQETDTTFKSNLFDISSDSVTFSETNKEYTRTQPLFTTPKPIESRRHKQNGIKRNNIRTDDEKTTVTSRSRTRTRSTRRPDDVTAATISSRTVHRGSRRRTENSTPSTKVTTSGPSLSGDEAYQVESRSRPGRRIEVPVTTEFIIARKDSFKRRTTGSSIDSSTEGARRKSQATVRHNFLSRSRFRSIPIIDETKLEVLPLFEAEPKTVQPPIRPRAQVRSDKEFDKQITLDSKSSKSGGVQDIVQTSATENDLRYKRLNDTVAIEKVVLSKQPNQTPPKVSVSFNVGTSSRSSVRRKPSSKSQIKESVVSEITEVTSKRTVTRRKLPSSYNVVTDKPIVPNNKLYSRGNKKSEVSLKKNRESSDEVDEGDNYPEAFKAVLQSKKDEKESRSNQGLRATSTTVTNFVTSPTVPTNIASSKSTKETNDFENEVEPRPTAATKISITRPSRHRFSTISPDARRSGLLPRKSSRYFRASTEPSSTTPLPKDEMLPVSDHKNRNIGKFTRKNLRGSYSSKLRKEDASASRERLNKSVDKSVLLSTKVPNLSTPSKKSNRYLSKYRSGISSRSPVIRSTTNAPVYIPTIPSAPYIPTVPTVTPSSSRTDNVWSEDATDYNWSFSRIY